MSFEAAKYGTPGGGHIMKNTHHAQYATVASCLGAQFPGPAHRVWRWRLSFGGVGVANVHQLIPAYEHQLTKQKKTENHTEAANGVHRTGLVTISHSTYGTNPGGGGRGGLGVVKMKTFLIGRKGLGLELRLG